MCAHTYVLGRSPPREQPVNQPLPTHHRPKVAVIGSGIAGLGAAWTLAPHTDVTIFEANDWIGGHANTRTVAGERGTEQVDTGFIVHNRRTYPELIRMFEALDVPTQPTRMSMAIHCSGCGLEYAGRQPWSIVRGALRRPRLIKLGFEIARFQRAALRDLPTLDPTVTLREYADAGGFSQHFSSHFLMPVTAAVWSAAPRAALDMPAAAILRFLDNHGMLSAGALEWRTVVGGSRVYVDKVVDDLVANGATIHVGTGAHLVERLEGGGAIVHSQRGAERFDHAVLATHADVSHALLDQPTELELAALAPWTYTRNRAVLHTDERMLPTSKVVRAAWNYHLPDCSPAAGPPTITYSMNRLQHLAATEEISVTLNRTTEIDPDHVHYAVDYAHPDFTVESMAAQELLPALAAAADQTSTSFCGAYHGYGFHEDGLRSGVQAARRVLQLFDLQIAAAETPVAAP
ncbi:MAG: FAD-dependent oxidoreductase [Thermoleophilia bacterium]|nr:FAD-dependent oxidoreductase [Thermoleophilia bacterium]